ncbi:unnamed protein product, partial [Ectocarpus sp. 12 AP-2014]
CLALSSTTSSRVLSRDQDPIFSSVFFRRQETSSWSQATQIQPPYIPHAGYVSRCDTPVPFTVRAKIDIRLGKLFRSYNSLICGYTTSIVSQETRSQLLLLYVEVHTGAHESSTVYSPKPS